MIKIIDIHEQPNLENFINTHCWEVSHIILKDKYTQVREDIVKSTELDDNSYIVDYTNNGYYTNDSRYMGKAFITIS
ncbi:hypothetical protein RPO40_11020, partial [Mammaliicoccus fleurettii]|nr:hypothetical protein [Mammaliicoccus fleurettii]